MDGRPWHFVVREDGNGTLHFFDPTEHLFVFLYSLLLPISNSIDFYEIIEVKGRGHQEEGKIFPYLLSLQTTKLSLLY
jgi:hypothetical protein